MLGDLSLFLLPADCFISTFKFNLTLIPPCGFKQFGSRTGLTFCHTLSGYRVTILKNARR